MQEKIEELMPKYGWQFKEGDDRYWKVSEADLFAQLDRESCNFYMVIEDGCISSPALTAYMYHIYCHYIHDGKIFEGRIETPEEFEVVMKVLGFEIIEPSED